MNDNNKTLSIGLQSPLLFAIVALIAHAFIGGSSYRFYTLIHTLLDEEGKSIWMHGSLIATIYGIVLMSVSAFLTLQKRSFSLVMAIVSLSLTSGMLYLCITNIDYMIPRTTPRWINVGSEWINIVVSMYAIVAVYSLGIIITYCIPSTIKKAVRNGLISICIPIVYYIAVIHGASLLDFSNLPAYFEECLLLVFIIGTLFFLVLLSGAIITLLRALPPSLRKTLQGILCIVCPVIGLAINNGHYSPFSLTRFTPQRYLIGDYAHWIFYLCAIVNGITLTFIAHQQKYARAAFLILSTTLPFSLYFLLVFLPFTPLALPACVFFGLGILMLTPHVVAYVHFTTYKKLFGELTEQGISKRSLWCRAAAMSSILPLLVIVSYYSDREVLHTALREIRSPDYSTFDRPSVDLIQLRKTLNHLQEQKKMQRDALGGTPYLSALYSSIVYDSLTLSDTTLSELNDHYDLGLELPNRPLPPFAALAQLRTLSTFTRYDPSKNYYTSTVTAIVESQNTFTQEEFRTEFTLPEDAWISGYQLKIVEEVALGQIVEKKVAEFVFNEIRGAQRDPGMLSYVGLHTLRLQVFPVTRDEPRTTQFTIIHRTPFMLTLAGQQRLLGEESGRAAEHVEQEPRSRGNITYIPPALLSRLPYATRDPHVVFIIDCSLPKELYPQAQLERLIKEHSLSLESIRVLVGTRSFRDIRPESLLSRTYTCHNDGGFDLRFALNALIHKSSTFSNMSYPLPIVVTSPPRAKVPEESAPFIARIPEIRHLVFATSKGIQIRETQIPYALLPISFEKLYHEKFPVRIYTLSDGKEYALRDSPSGALIYHDEVSESVSTETLWDQGLRLRGEWLRQMYYPSESTQRDWVEVIKGSIRTGILTPFTNYLVVENEAQRESIRRLQRARLAGNKDLDPGEMVRMDEPEIGIILALMCIVLCVRRFESWQKN